MKTYSPSDAKAEIIHNLGNIYYEDRLLPTPDTSFEIGEWAGLGNNGKAVKLDGDSVSVYTPRMVFAGTDRNDVEESEAVPVVANWYHLKTLIYKTGESFAFGDRIIVAHSGGKGTLLNLPSAAATYWEVGSVRKAPAVDGTDPLIAEIYPQPRITVVT